MSWIVLLRPEAEQDMATARDWYEKKMTGLGDQFRDEFVVAMQLLEIDPKRSDCITGTFAGLSFADSPTKYSTKYSKRASWCFAFFMAGRNTEWKVLILVGAVSVAATSQLCPASGLLPRRDVRIARIQTCVQTWRDCRVLPI